MSTTVNAEQSMTLLRSLRSKLDHGHQRISINHPLRFTKGETRLSNFEIYVDHLLRDRVIALIQSGGGWSALMDRYAAFDPGLKDLSWPSHFPVHILSGDGQVTDGSNIFMFFPEVLGISGEKPSDYFGLELIDAWECVFDQIITPCLQRIADEKTILEYFTVFCSRRREIIYLASVCHEIGHRVGIWKVSPSRDDRLSLTKMQIDVMGELSTDTYLVKFSNKSFGLAEFVLYQRLFWFGRMLSDQDAVQGALNSDNDAWIGAYLWQIAESIGCLKFNSIDSKYSIKHDLIANVFDMVFEDIRSLEARVLAAGPGDHSLVIQKWMEDRVPQSKTGDFVYPKSMADVFFRCSDVATRIQLPLPLQASQVAKEFF
jgi:hypothetical protein